MPLFRPKSKENKKHWKYLSNGSFSCTGKMKIWMQTFQSWYQQDTRRHSVDFGEYLTTVAAICGGLAKGKWEEEPQNKEKVEQLDSFVSTSPEGDYSVSVLDMIDYLAEHIDRQQMQAWSSYCRSQAKQMLKLG